MVTVIRNIPSPQEAPCRVKLSGGLFAIVDPDDYERLNRFYWKAVKSSFCVYAVRKYHAYGREFTIRMHREIAKTPPSQHCHHKNGHSLDNRKCNLENLEPLEHRLYHALHRICSLMPDMET